MEKVIFTLYDLIQIGLLLLACLMCYKAGRQRGIQDTLDYFESEGIIEAEPEEK